MIIKTQLLNYSRTTDDSITTLLIVISVQLQPGINVQFGVQHAMASTALLRPFNFPLSSKSAIGFTLKIWEHIQSVLLQDSMASALVKSFTSVASPALRSCYNKIWGLGCGAVRLG